MSSASSMSSAQSSTDELGILAGGQAPENNSARPLDTSKGGCTAERLPPELLAAIFAYLSRRRRIRASHVSRSWRTAALGSPQLWAKIDLICSTASEVDCATTLMSRAGSIADVGIVSYYPPRSLELRAEEEAETNQDPDTTEVEENDFDTIIVPYLHKIRSLWWSSSVPVRSLCHAAPFMERLHVTQELDIQSDFLAGGSGTLRTLRCGIVQLPYVCPALSSVTNLRIDDLNIDPGSVLPSLFHLFPALEMLSVGGLRHEYSHVLLSGHQPTSLRALTLKSVDTEWDMMQHFVDLHTPNLRMFSVDIVASDRAVLDAFPAPFLHGATGLHIREPFMTRGSWFVVTLPGAREHSLALPELCVPDLAEQIIASGARRLQSIRTLDITIDVLEHFVAVANALPALQTVTIFLETFEGSLAGPPRHPDTELVGWDALAYLQAVLDAAPQLRALVLDTHVSWTAPGAEFTKGDAKCILSHLEFLHERTAPVPEIVVLGFTVEIVGGLDLRGLPVRFDTAVCADDSAYWPFQVSYNDR